MTTPAAELLPHTRRLLGARIFGAYVRLTFRTDAGAPTATAEASHSRVG